MPVSVSVLRAVDVDDVLFVLSSSRTQSCREKLELFSRELRAAQIRFLELLVSYAIDTWPFCKNARMLAGRKRDR